MGVAARGITDAVEILGGKYHLVITNVPYLTSQKQGKILKDYLEEHYDEAKNDLATVFLERCLDFCAAGGTSTLVTPQNWLFLGSYQNMRKVLLKEYELGIIARLGIGAFETISGEVVNVILLASSRVKPLEKHCFAGLDASSPRHTSEKCIILKKGAIRLFFQRHQMDNPDNRIVLKEPSQIESLSQYATSFEGLTTGDLSRFVQNFWEHPYVSDDWELFIGSVTTHTDFGGRNQIIFWEKGNGNLVNSESSFIKGKKAWEKQGLRISQTRIFVPTIYTGELFDKNAATLIPKKPEYLPPIYCYTQSEAYSIEIRKIDQALKVTIGTLVKIPFDLEHWQKVAAKKYPNGLPEPYSEDPTQWLFKGTVVPSDNPLHVAIARLMGYRWPDQEPDALDELADDDGIVCLPSVRGEEPAAERLRGVLKSAYGEEWSPAKEAKLIAATGSKAADLDGWLRDDFFEQHCKLFHHRPFIWHIWDGRRRDGFHALVNYHKLAKSGGKGRQLLENLAYSYLGDWITRQGDGISREKGGAEDRLAAAVELKKKLETIIAGEPPFDIFVRWKPIGKQPIGWEPDINDGVRLNIRPFMAADLPGGRKDAGILRFKPNIKWGKDRGKEPQRPREEYPWFWENGKFTGNRVNDVHLTCEEKLRAREEG